MQGKLIVSAICCLLLTGSCKDKKAPEPVNQYSTWIVNGRDTFTSNDIRKEIASNPDHSYVIAAIGVNDYSNRFNLAFSLLGLPASGNWQISNGNGSSGNYAYLTFYFNRQFYILSSYGNYFLQANSVNNKARYTLDPAWYVNYYNHYDSIQIQGIFNEP